MTNWSWISSGILEPQIAENDHPPLTWHISLTTVYTLTCYTVINITCYLVMTDAFTDENSCIVWLWTSTLENRVYQVSRVKSFTKFENHSYSSYHNEGFNLTDLATFHLRNFPSLKKCGNCDVFTHISFTGHTEQCHEDVFILGYIGILKRNYETFVYRHWRTYYYFWLLRNRPFSRDYSRLGRMMLRSSSVKIYAGPDSCIDLHRRNVGGYWCENFQARCSSCH